MSEEDKLQIYRSFKELGQTYQTRMSNLSATQGLPIFMKYLQREGRQDLLLRCRQVSKTWLKKGDNFLENQASCKSACEEDFVGLPIEKAWNARARYAPTVYDELTNFPHFCGGVRLSTGINYNGEAAPSPMDFLETMNDCPKGKNPFPSHSVIITVKSSGGMNHREEYWQGVHQVLMKFGQHIWFIWFDFVSFAHSPNYLVLPDSLKGCLTCLQYTPNLKGFYFRGELFHKDYNSILQDPDWQLEPFGANIVSEAWTEVYSLHLPTLPQLESIQYAQVWTDKPNYENYDPFLSLQLTAILRTYAPQLTNVVVNFDMASPLRMDLLPPTFGNVQELRLKNIRKLQLIQMLEQFEFQQLPKLSISLVKNNEIELNWILRYLKRFPNLKYLELFVADDDEQEEFVQKRRRLYPRRHRVPSVEYLVVGDHPGINYDFLRCFPSLKRLMIEVACDTSFTQDTGRGQWISLFSLNNCLHESSIWDKFPNLQQILVKTGVKDKCFRDFIRFMDEVLPEDDSGWEPEVKQLYNQVMQPTKFLEYTREKFNLRKQQFNRP